MAATTGLSDKNRPGRRSHCEVRCRVGLKAGDFKLVTMIEKMRARIIELGGEIRFSTRVDDIHLDNGQVTGLTLSNGEKLETRHVVLAVGHSV